MTWQTFLYAFLVLASMTWSVGGVLYQRRKNRLRREAEQQRPPPDIDAAFERAKAMVDEQIRQKREREQQSQS